MAKSYQDRVPTKGLLSQNFEIRSPFQKAFYMVPKLSQREASIIEPVTQTTTVGTQSPSPSENKEGNILNTEKERVAGGMGGVVGKETSSFVSQVPLHPEARMSPGEVSIKYTVMMKFRIQVRPREKNERLIEQRQEERLQNCLHSKFRLLNKLFISIGQGQIGAEPLCGTPSFTRALSSPNIPPVYMLGVVTGILGLICPVYGRVSLQTSGYASE